MAKQRMINTRFWDDGFVRKLPASDKLLYLYLLTNPCTNIAGVYEITVDRMMFDTGMTQKRIIEAMDRMTTAGKIVFRDNWIVLTNFTKHQSKSNSVQQGIVSAINDCPDWVKNTLCIASPHLLTYLNLNPISKPKEKWNKSVVEVFEEWKAVLKKKSVLDTERHTLISDRLESYSLEELKLVPHGAAKSEWHNGGNPDRKKYLEIKTLFRNNDQVDKFIDLARNPDIQITSTESGPAVQMTDAEKQAKFEAQHYNDRTPTVIELTQ